VEPDVSAGRLIKVWMLTTRWALIDVGLDPDDPRVVESIDLVRWELSRVVERAVSW
jgi:hypothetical protein